MDSPTPEGLDLSKPKQIVSEISGFVPIFDAVVEQYHDGIRALVHGAVWRFCQMEDGVCRASLRTIAEWIGVNQSTVLRHMEVLVADEYFKDLTPDLKHKPHIYADTGKVVMKGSFKAGVAQRNSSVAQSNTSVAQSQLSKDSKKDSKKGDLVDLLLTTATEKERAEKEATNAFETAFGFSELPWWSAGSRWDKFLRFVVKVHGEDPDAFKAYVDWRNGDGKFNAMSNKQIRMNPQVFMDTSWAEFCATYKPAPRQIEYVRADPTTKKNPIPDFILDAARKRNLPSVSGRAE